MNLDWSRLASVAICFDAAQGCVVLHTDITLSPGNVGIDRLGYELDRVRIIGGDYAITGGSVSWQTLILDSVFEGQAKAAFKVYGIGPTLVRCTLRNTPKGFVIPGGEKRGGFTWRPVVLKTSPKPSWSWIGSRTGINKSIF